MPFGDEDAFRENEIEGPFKRYKERVKSYFLTENKENQIFDDLLFKPKAYCLFGNFDLAILSLVDSFGLATRSFHPFSHFINDEQNDEASYTPHNYTFHVISGLAPQLSIIDDQEPSLLERAKTTFLAAKNNHPFIGISSFKFNNSLITGGGGELVDMTLRAIRSRLSGAQKNSEWSFQYLIFYSFSWHELSIVFFSDRYTTIADQVFKIRELTVENLREVCQPNTAYNYDRVTSSSLLHQLLEDDPREKETDKLHNAHLFVHSNTIFGYDSDIIVGDQSDVTYQSEEGVTFRIKWDIKPGHLSAFLNDLGTLENTSIAQLIREKGRVTAGRGDYAYVIEENAMSRFVEIVKLIIGSPLSKHVRKVNTTPTFSSKFRKDDGRNVDLDKHYLVNDKLASYRFKLQEISELRVKLRKLRLPKIIQEKVNNMYTIFNDGISDPILYNYFVELRPYLEEIINLIELFVELSDKQAVLDITELLNAITRDFEMAYQNRFGQSYIMNEITDFNLKFNGGIQQLVSLFDGAYKTLTSFFEEGEYSRSMAYVAGVSNTMSDLLSVRLNYFHLYQPVFFAATATHEAANFIPERYYISADVDEEVKQLFAAIKSQEEELEQQHLRYFLVDIVTYYTAFAEDFELFQYWRWSVYMQMGIAYNVDGSLKQDSFNMLFKRLYLVAHLTNNSAFFEGAIHPPFKPLNSFFIEAWETAYLHAKTKGASFLKEHKPLLNTAKSIAMSYLLVDLFKDIKDINEEELHDKIQSRFKADPETYEKMRDYQDKEPQNNYFGNNHYERIAYARKYHIKDISEEIRERLSQGQTYSFVRKRKHPHLAYAQDSFFLQALMLTYLKLIKTLNDDIIAILPRSSDTGKIERQKLIEEGASFHIWFDPLGGFFTTCAAIRAKHFRLRSAFLKSLWDFSAKRKLKLFEGIFVEEDIE